MKNRVPHATPIQRFFRQVRRNRFWLLTYLWLALALPELLLHCAASPDLSSLFSAGLILGPLFALIPGMVLFFLCTAIPRPGLNYGIALTYSALVFLFWGAQAVYFRQYGSFFTLRSLGDFGVMERLSGLWKGIPGHWGVLIGMAVPTLILLFLGKKLFSFRAIKSRRSHGILLLFCLGLHILLVLALPLFGGTGDLSAYGLYHHTRDSYYSINRLGMLTSLRLELQRNATGHQPNGTITPESLPTEPSMPPSPMEAMPVVPEGENRLELDFAALAGAEKRTEISEVHRYFAGRLPTDKNEKTGLFRGCNLILIAAEDFRQSEISPEAAPALHRLMTEGFSFRDYYVPDWALSPEEAEYALLTGLIPAEGCLQASTRNLMPLTISQQLIREGYSVCSFAADCGPERQDFLENLGFEVISPGSGAISDRDLLDLSAGNYVNASSFFVFYRFQGSAIGELDSAVELLMHRLQAAGVLEQTAILITPCKGEDSETGGMEACRNGCILWKSGMEGEEITGPSSLLDLLPTLSNLYGLEFDSRLYMGRDLFSDGIPLVLFRNRSWITDRAVYRADTGKIAGESVSSDYVNKIATEVSNRFTVSARIIQYDYWRTLFSPVS